jgi:thiamine biosynthesis lipoprotein
LIHLPAEGAAVASSSVLIRRWGGDRHHIIDPPSGHPAHGDVVAATVVAAEGAWADAATKAALVAGTGQEAVRTLEDLQVEAVLVLRNAQILATTSFSHRYLTQTILG